MYFLLVFFVLLETFWRKRSKGKYIICCGKKIATMNSVRELRDLEPVSKKKWMKRDRDVAQWKQTLAVPSSEKRLRNYERWLTFSFDFWVEICEHRIFTLHVNITNTGSRISERITCKLCAWSMDMDTQRILLIFYDTTFSCMDNVLLQMKVYTVENWSFII